jgi:hypothetical protein
MPERRMRKSRGRMLGLRHKLINCRWLCDPRGFLSVFAGIAREAQAGRPVSHGRFAGPSPGITFALSAASPVSASPSPDRPGSVLAAGRISILRCHRHFRAPAWEIRRGSFVLPLGRPLFGFRPSAFLRASAFGLRVLLAFGLPSFCEPAIPLAWSLAKPWWR